MIGVAMVMMVQAPVDAATRKAILDAARVPAATTLGKPVLFKVSHLGLSGDWAFMRAEMQGPCGARVDYAGTPLADAARNGAVSSVFAALLHRRGNAWTVVDTAIGPTDVAWEDWAARHGAPSAIFG